MYSPLRVPPPRRAADGGRRVVRSLSLTVSAIASLQQRGTLTRTNNGNKHAGWSTRELADLHPPPSPQHCVG